ncbi:hypothetical protein GUJ93_ZPchr0013g37561 [Zizania palustris]|uniref:Uncharacterized protein n=1 Tax=Zizania palustris TaxID=103762 RepID=A0A8J6C1N4_ZIZPA|nr:hypothetical protein GUJ93_ZPchr0013g37561 [Zizania palustris]
MAAAGYPTDDERRALRGSKFAPLPSPTAPTRPQPRMAHPGGPLTTNKSAALAKFLERKLQQPDGLDSLNPDLVKLAVKNAKETIKANNGTNGAKLVQEKDKEEDVGDHYSKQMEKKDQSESSTSTQLNKNENIGKNNKGKECMDFKYNSKGISDEYGKVDIPNSI